MGVVAGKGHLTFNPLTTIHMWRVLLRVQRFSGLTGDRLLNEISERRRHARRLGRRQLLVALRGAALGHNHFWLQLLVALHGAALGHDHFWLQLLVALRGAALDHDHLWLQCLVAFASHRPTSRRLSPASLSSLGEGLAASPSSTWHEVAPML